MPSPGRWSEPALSERRCCYVTADWGIHDERWCAALRTLGYKVEPVSLARDGQGDLAQLRALVAQHTDGHVPVVAGPLNTITRHLIDLPAPIIGLSWGFDLHELAKGDDVAWLRQLDALIVDSTATEAIAEAAGVDPSVITNLPWGIDLEVFTPDADIADLESFGVKPGERVLLSLRAHESIYRVHDIVSAFAQLDPRARNVRLLVGHVGSQTPELVALAQELQIADRISFIGSLPETALAPLLRAVDGYVSASTVDGTSVTLLQAMACHTPVVVSDTAGNLGWVTATRTGRVFTTEDPASLAQQLRELLDDPASSERMALAAGELVRRDADWSRNIARLDEAVAHASGVGAATTVLIAAAGAPELLEVQLAAIRRFFPAATRVVVVDDSRRRRHVSNDHQGDVTDRMKRVALAAGAQYERFPQWLHFARWRLYPGRTRHWSPNPSPRTADSLQFGVSRLPRDTRRLVILDSDMVPIEPIDLDARLGECPVWVLPQERTGPAGPITYPWPGIVCVDAQHTRSIFEMNWDCADVDGIALDTGGAMRDWLSAQPYNCVTGLHSGRWHWRSDAPGVPDELHEFLDIDADQNDGSQYCELFLGSFLHMRAGSNWNGMDPVRFERRRSSFIDGVRALVSSG